MATHLYDELLPEKLPEPAGWKILIKPVEIQKRTAGGIELPVESQEAAGYARNVGQVIAMGPDCYSHPKFCDAPPWCKVGDWVRFRRNGGDREKVHGPTGPVELIYINDDEVVATADSPDIWIQEL